MNKIKILILALFVVNIAMAQDRNNEDGVVKLNPQSSRFNSKPNELLVKFKTGQTAHLRSAGVNRVASSISAVDNILMQYDLEEVDQLLPNDNPNRTLRSAKAFSGEIVRETSLNQLYRLRVAPTAAKTHLQLIEELKALPEVEFAEPNYIVSALGMEAAPSAQPAPQTTTFFIANDPLYFQQWGIPAVQLPALYDKPVIRSKRQVIAILDTGVDTEHPDLAANIWTNTSETDGAADYDDDANGFKDDIHGWDFVNQSPNVRDNNSHGTHCAGIAAAAGNNNIGIYGANPNALIMPVTVLQSNGTGDVATIIKAINYAAQNGADIISMSFGGYGYSIAYEQALAQAYQTSILVAAAGNDALGIHPYCGRPDYRPMYPGAFTFVLGVQANAAWSNFDCSGPVYSEYAEDQLYNYELIAPGSDIISTVPGGQYRKYNGTSMATPLVAGGIAALIDRKEFASQEELWTDLIQSSFVTPQIQGLVNFNSAFYYVPQPKLDMVNIETNDSINGDGDMRPDVGELIDFYPVLKNWGGSAENVWIKLSVAEFEDPSIIKVLNDSMFVGTLTPYAKMKAPTPIQIKVDSNLVDGRIITMQCVAWYNNFNKKDTTVFSIKVENGVELKGMLTEDMTLYPNTHYIVTENFAIPKDVHLTILPGTVIKIKQNTSIASAGIIHAVGTPDQPIVFTKTDLDNNGGTVNFGDRDTVSYCKFSYLTLNATIGGVYDNIGKGYVFDADEIHEGDYRYPDGSFFPGTFEWYPQLYFTHNVVENCWNVAMKGYIKNNNIHNCTFGWATDLQISNANRAYTAADIDFMVDTLPFLREPLYESVIYNNMVNNISYFRSIRNYSGDDRTIRMVRDSYSNIFNNKGPEHWGLGVFDEGYMTARLEVRNAIFSAANPVIIKNYMPAYWGSGVESIARKGIFDFHTPQSGSFAVCDLSNISTRPAKEAHGIVWKVVVNGYDAQDEFDLLPPLGVGTHKFEVYFNRAMDTIVTPMVAMGVRSPYTQNAIAENRSWSADSTIYTAYYTVKAAGSTDGLNRIYVANAQDDEHFEIPFENQRFNVVVQSAGSLSAGFMATPGLGKIELEWESPEESFDDLLGYNMYRYTYDAEKSIYSDTVLINSALLLDTLFTDFDVVPGQTYNYMYKVLRTDLSENDFSKSVSAVPLTASKGDSNGSLAIDVADVVTTVGYITGNNPQPFIFEAADVNSDSRVDVLDVVGTVNLILNPQSLSPVGIRSTAVYSIENNRLFVESPVALGGVQFRLKADKDKASIQPLAALQGFEIASQWLNDSTYLLMAFSMTGNTIDAGKNALLQLTEGVALQDIILADPQGKNISVVNAPTAVEGIYKNDNNALQVFPNPFRNELHIVFNSYLNTSAKVDLLITDLSGKTVDRISGVIVGSGRYEYTYIPRVKLNAGIYFCTLRINNTTVKTERVIYLK
jgi:subtilisin family serine protease